MVKTVTELDSLRKYNLSVLAENFDETFKFIIKHYEEQLMKREQAFQ